MFINKNLLMEFLYSTAFFVGIVHGSRMMGPNGVDPSTRNIVVPSGKNKVRELARPPPPSPTMPLPTRLPTLRPTFVDACPSQVPGNFTYRGGPVMNNVEITPLFWGSVSYASNIVAFYKGISQSPYMDWLSEYCTPTKGSIGRGKGNNAIWLSNVTTLPLNTTLDDDLHIKPMLLQLIGAGIIKPSVNAYFPIHFGPGYSISLGESMKSCVEFCAYHFTMDASNQTGGQYVMYGVLPELATGACSKGCGSYPTALGRTTGVASHELVEAITDPLAGLGYDFLSWYNDVYGEIGDICNGMSATTTDSNSKKWIVQKQWSNIRNQCYSPP